MFNVFALNNGRLNQLHVDTLAGFANSEPIWIDLVSPSDQERGWVKQLYQLGLPEYDDLQDIEVSARFFETDEGELHLRSDFLLEGEDLSRNINVAFNFCTETSYSACMRRTCRCSGWCVCEPVHVGVQFRTPAMCCSICMLPMWSTLADALEGVYAELEKVSGPG